MPSVARGIVILRYGLAFADQTPLESEEERQAKRSVELMRIKELTLSVSERSSSEDSGVSEHPGLKSRPTSMSVIMDKQKKQDRRRERSKTKEEKKAKNEDMASLKKKTSEWRKFKTSLKHLFRREKS
ncbi:hypothetical protein BDW02DRAFT_635431 [Decorospora gaudefroyi]|uniref:Uncharacterized protein n=1 Tax=Decorospora gaudefroyi TaxID=184978 RepID=A0A6A5JXI4_9PLEO|nr:hypothetical protein BDW02DRAFT_635431 [Decorospora gaudefroyi]